MGLFKDKSINMSIPDSEKIHGLEVKKVPIRDYLKALKKFEELPNSLMYNLFGEIDINKILAIFSTGNNEAILSAAGKLIFKAPEPVINILCEIAQIDKEQALSLTPKEFTDVIKAFWKLNDLSDFFRDVWGVIKKNLLTQNTGSSAG